jgi:hypothetical protein
MYYSPKILALLLLGTLIRNANGAPCEDRAILVTQQGDPKEYEFKTVDSKDTVEDFYDYTNYGYNGVSIVPTEKGRSMMFIHRNIKNDDCELSLVVVHDHKANDAILGKVRLWFLPDIASKIKVKDDGNDSYSGNGQRTTVLWKFRQNEKDGLAFNLGKDFECFSVNPRGFQGITDFVWAAPTKTTGTDTNKNDVVFTPLSMATGKVIEVCRAAQEEEPEALYLRCEVTN